MRMQVRLLVEPLVAAGVRAAERFFAGVDSQMGF